MKCIAKGVTGAFQFHPHTFKSALAKSTNASLHRFNTGLKMCNIKRFFTMKTLLLLANITFTIILAAQLSQVLGGYFKPSNTRTWEEEVPLKDIDFPLVMKICVNPGFNQSALFEMGYDNTWKYFIGQSRFHHLMFEWAGHTKDLKLKGSVEKVLRHVTVYGMKNILDSLVVVRGEGGVKGGPLSKLLKQAGRASYPNNCQSLSLPNIRNIQNIWLVLREGVKKPGYFTVGLTVRGGGGQPHRP